MKTSEALKPVFNQLWDGDPKTHKKKSVFLCHAVHIAVKNKKISKKVKLFINGLLNGHGTLESWLAERKYQAFSKENAKIIQNTRKQWLEYIISYYEYKGD